MNKRIKKVTVLSFILLFLTTALVNLPQEVKNQEITGAPPDGEPEINAPALSPLEQLRQNWKRPAGPPKVGLQVGHLNNKDFPEELKNLRKNGGSSGGGYTEAKVNLAIAEKMAGLLEKKRN